MASLQSHWITMKSTRRLLRKACWNTLQVSYSQQRAIYLSTQVQREEKMKIVPDPPANPKADWIGPPDPKSNIRPYKYYIPEDETAWQREFRLRREDNRQWNHAFWLDHNKYFFEKKEEFVKRKLEEKQASGEESESIMTPEEMAVFYKQFLDDKFQTHMQYNKDWYRRNISLLWPALKVALENLWRRKSR